jgi:hypothetical protein
MGEGCTMNKPAKKKDQEIYCVTFKGLLLTALGFSEELTKNVLDSLELYLRRFYMTEPGECGAVIFDGKTFHITSVTKAKK